MEAEIINKEIEKINIDINKTLDEVIDATCHESKSKKRYIKHNIIFLN